MKKRGKQNICFAAILCFVTSFGYAQHMELTAFGGGTFAAGINNYSTYYYKAQIGGSFHYGGTLDYFIRSHTSINLTVFDQPTTGYLYGKAGYNGISAPVSLTYFLIGLNRCAA